MPQPPPISLTILRKGDTNLIDLAEVGTLIPRSETRVDDAFLHQLVAEVTRVATPGYGRGEGQGVVQELQRIGALLFSQLLTEPARKRLRTAESCDLYLRLDEQLVHLPWEPCYDEEQFLAMKFRLGRQVITSAPVRSMSPARQERSPLRVLLIVDPTETLPQAGEEAERLCHFFSGTPKVEVTLLGGHEVRKAPLLAALQTHDLVHFAGHSQYDPRTPSSSGWQLHEGMVTVAELGQLAHPPLLIFSNSCQAGATVDWGASSHYDEQAFGIGSAFLLAGVKNYIGTFWVVQDEESAVFATAFYHSLTAGQSIGEALSQARQTILAQRGWQGLTWASYMLYGDPALIVLPPTQARPLASVSTFVQPQRAQVMQRKLAAILSADVKGYSRLMGEDEVATIRTLTAYREVITALIQQHQGRVVDAPGDNLLAEFASAVDAVQCAVEIQGALKTRNAELPSNRQMEFRIGINVGDVLIDGERIYGDGVNIAARVESLAEGGGICLSGTAYDQVKNKLTLGYEFLGEQEVKNIAQPVRVYCVREQSAGTAAESKQTGTAGTSGALPGRSSLRSGVQPGRSSGVNNRKFLLGLGGLLLLLAAIVMARYVSFRLPAPSTALPPGPSPALLLPDKPSIVVLPFTNMSNDPSQDYFSDGLTEDLTTDLSKLSGLFVIASNSALTYKGKARNVQEVSKELGVRYTVEGSVRKADNQVRITVQLVDTTTSPKLVWSERYDRPLKEIFALQDEIRHKIVLALRVKLTPEEQQRFQSAPTDNLDAYDYLLQGAEHYYRFTPEANAQARQLCEKALELDPRYEAAYRCLALTYLVEFQKSRDPQTAERAFTLVQKALALKDTSPQAHEVLGNIYLWAKKQPKQAIAEGERAIALGPNCVGCYADLAVALGQAGRPAEAVGFAEQALRLDPIPSLKQAYYWSVLGQVYRLTGRYEEAVIVLRKALILNPNSLVSHLNLASTFSELDQEQEARAEIAEVLRIFPKISLEMLRQQSSQEDSALLERTLAALRKAGLR